MHESGSLPDPTPVEEREIDPDPFTIGLGIFAIIISGGGYLEARRQREFIERQAQESFRRAWFEARRTLIHARRAIEEFATYVGEDGYGARAFTFGSVKLTLDRGRAEELRRLHANALTTAKYMADNVDTLADFLGSGYQGIIDQIMQKLTGQQLPKSYDEVVGLAREGLALFETLIQQVGEELGEV